MHFVIHTLLRNIIFGIIHCQAPERNLQIQKSVLLSRFADLVYFFSKFIT